ncbi:Gfo/Idh/MocA family protein [Gellertiella hungarica]|uniref:Putative dehydrogenase n=1 Tax=Gellertiella hungarica TaxID=1572859 RepID=A0A7W6J8Y6_9HYPH|nr:Gfo/Idh/MocA family oxidoreductase [Gellertiella hungarica]MBB4066126.1 putative dehydrogenase [Gellertiella hungarica]
MNDLLRTAPAARPAAPADPALPRLAFLGVGWIGRHRMKSLLEAGLAEAVALADASPEALEEAARIAPGARVHSSLDALIAERPDGLVIATPSAQHAEQAIAALEAGIAVFCQKPLGRSEAEARAVIEAARRADRLLGVDFSYRHTAGMEAIRELVRSGALGTLLALDLTFHNAYGPDKPWFYDRALSGGGAVMDLGVHLVDLALWLLDFPEIAHVDSHLSAGGEPLVAGMEAVEDFAVATLTPRSGPVIRIACSWRLQAGRDAVIEASVYGTGGGAAMRNVDGSFYDFVTERFHGTRREALARPPEDWGGKAIAAWAARLARSKGFDPSAEGLAAVSAAIDRIYAAAR